ncbi:hypothetical protein ACIBJD_01345 [Kitasatospora sp. NPDC050467]|uniref:hypothetical protein n=1 Tax=Kitasatospora sp. NPDC050467 TaxID=3364053 RepID=UPI0037AC7C01
MRSVVNHGNGRASYGLAIDVLPPFLQFLGLTRPDELCPSLGNVGQDLAMHGLGEERDGVGGEGNRRIDSGVSTVGGWCGGPARWGRKGAGRQQEQE